MLAVMRRLVLLLSLVSPLAACERDEPATQTLPATRVLDLDGQPLDPFASRERAVLLLFVRTDCPISNRYAPKLGRIAARFAADPLDVYLVYVDHDETPARIREHVAAYALPGTPLRDVEQVLAARAQTLVTPEAALFDRHGELRYHGRIDDGWVDYGKPRAAVSSDELVDAIVAVLAGERPKVEHAEAIGCPLPPLRGAQG